MPPTPASADPYRDPVKKPPNRPPHCELSLRLPKQFKLLVLRLDEGNADSALYVARAILRQVDEWAQGRKSHGSSNDEASK